MAYEGDFGATLGSLRRHFWHAKDFGVTLGSLFIYDVDFVAILVSLGGHFWDLRAPFWAV